MIDGEFESAEEREILALALNGITRVQVSHYLVDGYRYAALADAMAQVRRSAAHRARARQAGLFGRALLGDEPRGIYRDGDRARLSHEGKGARPVPRDRYEARGYEPPFDELLTRQQYDDVIRTRRYGCAEN